jgi:hypothetical protein
MNDFLHLCSKDVISIGKETSWCAPALLEFWDDLKKIGEERILRATFRGLREMR